MSGRTSNTPAAAREPLAGYNHNIRYHERIYHVQTEDSGLARPHILTHLFLDGMIVASLRTDYSELVAAPDNEAVVREIMQEQHKQIMKMLRRGELDGRIAELKEEGAPEPTLEYEPETAAKPAPAPAAKLEPAAKPEPAPEPEPELPPEFAPAPPSSPRVVSVPDTTTAQRGCVTLVDFPPVLDAQLKAAIAEQQQQQQQPQPPPAQQPEVAGPPLSPTPISIELPDEPPESIELEPLAEAAQMADPIQALDSKALVLTPPPERVVNRKEARSIRRGQAISREIQLPAALKKALKKKKKPEVGQRIDLDHPAFSAFPMLEWEGDDDDALELDLEAINNLDLDAEPRRLDSQQLEAIELELELPPEPLPAPRPRAAREAAGAALAGDPLAAPSLAVEPRRSSSPSWGEELELEEPDDFEMMVTPSGPIPIPRLPTPHSAGEQLSPLPALNEERKGRKPSLPPVQAAQRPLEVEPTAPPPVKRASAPAPEHVDDPPAVSPGRSSPTPPPASSAKAPARSAKAAARSAKAAARSAKAAARSAKASAPSAKASAPSAKAPVSSAKAPPSVSPRILKRPSLPVIPLSKLVEIEPEVVGKERSDPTVGEKPSTRAKGAKPTEDESNDDDKS